MRIWIQRNDGERILPCLLPLYNHKTVELDRYDHMTALLDAALIPRYHRVHEFVCKKKVLYLCKMYQRQDAVKKEWGVERR